MATTIIHGRDLIVKCNGHAIAGSRSCELQIQCEEIETSSASQGKWREFIAGRIDWMVTCSQLVTVDSTDMPDTLPRYVGMIGQMVQLTFEIRDSVDNTLSGYAIVKSWKATGTIPNLSQGSFVFRGNGILQ